MPLRDLPHQDRPVSHAVRIFTSDNVFFPLSAPRLALHTSMYGIINRGTLKIAPFLLSFCSRLLRITSECPARRPGTVAAWPRCHLLRQCSLPVARFHFRVPVADTVSPSAADATKPGAGHLLISRADGRGKALHRQASGEAPSGPDVVLGCAGSHFWIGSGISGPSFLLSHALSSQLTQIRLQHEPGQFSPREKPRPHTT